MLYVGPGFATHGHRHHAAQICIGLDGPARVRAPAGRWMEAPALLILPDRAHETGEASGRIALAYLEPEAAECRQLLARSKAEPAGIGELSVDEPARRALAALIDADPSLDEAEAACRQALHLEEPATHGAALDPRVRAALDRIAGAHERPVRLAELAREVGLSPSHLAHLFTREVGIPLRRYVLWLRLRRAAGLAMRGHTATDAAHEAGFADAAHLTRTFRRMFGVTPSWLGRRESGIDVRVDELDADRPGVGSLGRGLGTG